VTGLLILVGLYLTGCATKDDLRQVRTELDGQIQATNEKVASAGQGLASLRAEVTELRNGIAKIEEAIQALRTSQAEGRADITDIRDQLQQARGTADNLRKDISSLAVRTGKREDEEKALREKLDKITFRLNFMENFLGIDKGDESSKAPAGKQSSATQTGNGSGKVRTDKESRYAAAYDLFKDEKFDKSREAFDGFLKQYPDTEFSDNAQYWLGECYYFEKKYEKAIVEYDKVIKNFPEGNKVPFALYKQGLSFLNLGEKASGKLLLQQVARDYPDTSQARMAREKLLEIK
jgi:tol-pal system protein YbgF